MNIKKVFVVSCIALQFSHALFSIPYYDMAKWNAAFLAFGGGTDPKLAASVITANSINSNGALGAAQPGGVKVSDEANAVGAFVVSGITDAKKASRFSSKYTATDVQNAIAVAKGTMQNGTSDQQGGGNDAPQLSENQAATVGSLTAGWTAAFNAMGGTTGGVTDRAQKIFAKDASLSKSMPSGWTTTTVGYGDAQVIVKYLNLTAMHATDSLNLDNAFKAANVQRTSGSSDSSGSSSSSSSSTQAPAKAQELRTQIQAAVDLYNTVAGAQNSGITPARLTLS